MAKPQTAKDRRAELSAYGYRLPTTMEVIIDPSSYRHLCCLAAKDVSDDVAEVIKLAQILGPEEFMGIIAKAGAT